MKNNNFILWVRYNSLNNGRQYEKQHKIKAKDIFLARVKAENILSKYSGEIDREQLYYA